VVAKRLKRSEAGDRHGRRFFERDIRRLVGELFRARECELRPRVAGGPEDVVPWPKVRDGIPDCFDSPRDIATYCGALRPAQPTSEAGRKEPGDAVPLDRIDRGGVHPEEHLVVFDVRPFDVPQFEEVRPAIPNVHDGFHLAALSYLHCKPTA
jgi:hypothetical protein